MLSEASIPMEYFNNNNNNNISHTISSKRQHRQHQHHQDTTNASETSSASFSQHSSNNGYAASLIASTIGSWDEEEQDYDEKSTKKVVEMMNLLDNILYQDEESSCDNADLISECQEWNSMFPHIRIRANPIIPAKDQSFQIMSHQEIRSASPYFFIPDANPVSLSTDHAAKGVEGFCITGVSVAAESIRDKNSILNSDTHQDVELDIVQTSVCWTDDTVQETVESLKTKKLSWAIFKIIEDDIENDRSTTPTQGNPYRESKKDTLKQLTVKVVLVSTASLTFKDELVKMLQLDDGKKTCIFGIENCASDGYLLAHTVHQNNLYNIDYSDFAEEFRDALLYHHHHSSISRFSASSVIEMYTCQEASHGQVDEYFAFDNRDASNAPAHQSKNPYNPIKEDLIHSIFDDLWSEIFPKFNDIVTKLSEDLTSNKSVSAVSTIASSIHCGSDEEEEEEISGFGLLSAITIKPIPLQKRDLYPARRVIDNPPSPEPTYYFHPAISTTSTVLSEARPASAKPSLGFSGRPSRPTSAKPQELYGRLHTPVKFTARQQPLRSHHRLLPLSSCVNQGQNTNSLNEAMYVTSMAKPNSHREHRPATSSHLNKKLPPLRGIIVSSASINVNTGIDQQDFAYPSSSSKIQRHVAFDQSIPPPVETIKREMSPRPYSASRRPIAGNLRSRTYSRPHTAISESLSKIGSSNSLKNSSVHGTAFKNSSVNGTAFGKMAMQQRSYGSSSNHYKYKE